MNPPPLTIRRAAALAVLAVLLAGVHGALVVPVVEAWIAADQAVVQSRESLGRVRAIAAGADGLEAALQARRARLAGGPDHYQAASDTLVATQVQDRLKAAVERAGATLSSVNMLPVGEEGPFRRIALRAQIEARLPVLQMLLHELENGHPVVLIDTLSVRAPPPRAGRDAADPVLMVQFDLFAFARIEAPRTDAP